MSPHKAGAATAAPAGPRRKTDKAPDTAGLIALDSSCWLEFFADSPRAGLFAAVLEDPQRWVVPVLTVYEVSQKLHREVGEEAAAAALSLMQQGQVVPVDLPLALAAAVNGLPMADSLIYATARLHGAELWTQDAHFKDWAGVRYFPKGE